MQSRKDGADTRRRLLEAACKIFGEKGYRDATNADICALAEANIAAINYHFGSKADLYRAAWVHGAECADELYPLDGGIGPDSSAQQKLSALIKALISRRTDRERLAQFHRIRQTEMVNPTELLGEVMAQHLEKTHKYSASIISDLLGPKASQKDIELCESSVVSQCFMPRIKGMKIGPPPLHDRGADSLDELAEHITAFSIAGLKAIRKQIESRN